jgi:hypothetical protein
MNKKNFVLLPIILPIVLAILALPTAAFGDTVKCKEMETIIAITLQLCRKSPSIIIVI